ncbi:ApaG protein [Pseudoscourfieldia marina]
MPGSSGNDPAGNNAKNQSQGEEEGNKVDKNTQAPPFANGNGNGIHGHHDLDDEEDTPRLTPIARMDHHDDPESTRRFEKILEQLCGSTDDADGLENEEGEVCMLEVIEHLQELMDSSVSDEKFEEAAKYRDLIDEAERLDPILGRERELERAVREERYVDAAKLRDALAELRPPPPKPVTESDSVANGVRVRVKSFYVPERSSPERGQYFFAYRVAIKNSSDASVQVRSRRWVIVDDTGHREEVRGPGIVGEQPILSPGSTFEYTSACPLRTIRGRMSGEFRVIIVNENGEQKGDTFGVPIATFALDAEHGEKFHGISRASDAKDSE